MRFIVGFLSLLTIPAGCLRLPGLPAAAATRPAVWATSAVRAAKRTVLRREALLIGKVHRVARGGGDVGGGGEEGEERSEGVLARAASLPLLQVLPPQVQTAVVVNTVGFGLLEATRKRGSILTVAGAVNAYALGLVLWASLGGWGWGTCVLYLAAGSAVTKIKMAEKQVQRT
ncbi:unnamed protein product [Laminaria digitata]